MYPMHDSSQSMSRRLRNSTRQIVGSSLSVPPVAEASKRRTEGANDGRMLVTGHCLSILLNMFFHWGGSALRLPIKSSWRPPRLIGLYPLHIKFVNAA